MKEGIPMGAIATTEAWREAQRVQNPPPDCPKCRRHNEGKNGWHAYNVIDEAPAAGCGNCGYVVLLTERYHGV